DERLISRLLSMFALVKRIAIADNLKGLVSSSLLEGLITTTEISGHDYYKGEGTRPNYLTWFATSNAVRLSRDLSERSIIINLTRPQPKSGWREAVFAYVEKHRDEILADIIAELRKPPIGNSAGDRWQCWTDTILARVTDDVPGVLSLLRSRREDHDDDLDEVRTMIEAARLCIEEKHIQDGFVPAADLAECVGRLQNSKWSTRRLALAVKAHTIAGRLVEVEKADTRKVRGYFYRGN
ncbi:MAG: hypothetical protein AAB353_07000, partial [Candidatus Hydrogenedentota bacterium]